MTIVRVCNKKIMELKDFKGIIESVDQKSFKDDVERRQALVAARELCRRLETPMDTIVRLCWVEVRL